MTLGTLQETTKANEKQQEKPETADMAQTPAERAMAAAVLLSDRGQAVTVRAIKTEARVSTAVAMDAANEWNTSREEALWAQVPQMSEDFAARIEALWPEAWVSAYKMFAEEKKGLEKKIIEKDELIADFKDDYQKISKRNDELGTTALKAQEALHKLQRESDATIEGLEKKLKTAENRIRKLEKDTREALAEREDDRYNALLEQIKQMQEGK